MTLERLFGTWLALAAAMTLNGALRELLLRRWLAADDANLVSALFGVVIILSITRVTFRRFATSTDAALVQTALLLVTLTVAFEFAIGRLVDGASWAALAAHYAFWRGEPWPFVLLLLAATPYIWGRWLPADRRHAH